MHLYMMTRGIKSVVDNYISDLQAQYYKYGDKGMLQLSVRPIQLWEVVFPQESLKEVLQTVLPYENLQPGSNWKVTDWRSKYLAGLRFALGAQKIPEMDLTDHKNILRPLRKDNITVYPIGIKPDNLWTEGPLGPKPAMEQI